MRIKHLCALILFTIPALLLPNIPAAAEICPPPPAARPAGCTDPVPGGPGNQAKPPLGGPMGGPMGIQSGSGFQSKYPKSRSIDLFSNASPQVMNPGSAPIAPGSTTHIGVGWDSSLRLQSIPYIKAEKMLVVVRAKKLYAKLPQIKVAIQIKVGPRCM